MHKDGPMYRYTETSTNRAIHLLVESLYAVYHFASDIEGEGLGVELLNASGDVVAEVFRCDADQSIIVSTLDNNILLSVIEWLPDVAHGCHLRRHRGAHAQSSVGWESPTQRPMQSPASG